MRKSSTSQLQDSDLNVGGEVFSTFSESGVPSLEYFVFSMETFNYLQEAFLEEIQCDFFAFLDRDFQCIGNVFDQQRKPLECLPMPFIFLCRTA